ncbi:MAG: hypothetical protein ACI4MM_00505 [Candidatus Ventricola sp.]
MNDKKGYTAAKEKIPSAGRDIGLLIPRPTAAAQPACHTPGILWIHGGGYATGFERQYLYAAQHYFARQDK